MAQIHAASSKGISLSINLTFHLSNQQTLSFYILLTDLLTDLPVLPSPAITGFTFGVKADLCSRLHRDLALHSEDDPGEILKSIALRCYFLAVAFVWELTEETMNWPLGCLQGGSRILTAEIIAHGRSERFWASAFKGTPDTTSFRYKTPRLSGTNDHDYKVVADVPTRRPRETKMIRP